MSLFAVNNPIRFDIEETQSLERWTKKNNWKLGKVIPIGLGVIAALNLLTALVSRHNIKIIVESMNWVNVAHEVNADLRLLEKQLVDAETGQRGFLLTGNQEYLEPYENTDKLIDEIIDELRGLIIEINQLEKLNQVEIKIEKRLEEMATTIEYKKNDRQAELQALLSSNLGKNTMDEIRRDLKIMEEEENKILAERKEIARAAEQANLVTTGTSLSIFLLVCLMIWFVLRQVIKPIESVALAISSSSSQIASTVEEHERIANQQASLVNETTTTIDELGASSRQAASQAEAAAVNVERLLLLSIGENETKTPALEHELNLKETSAQIAHEVMGLSEKLTQIDRIAGVVSQLAAQTNMLALNAAVEAVRAGEQGKGFGVIAAEIRKLADRSGKYAEQINGLTSDIQTATQSTVNVTEAGTEVVEKMVKSINETTLNIKQISLSANQQAIAIQQTVEAMTSINQGASETASGIAQTKTSTQQLNAAAQTLKSLI